jgi:hypothetical protein
MKTTQAKTYPGETVETGSGNVLPIWGFPTLKNVLLNLNLCNESLKLSKNEN